jgi:AraC family transcriptional regulator, activator of mtrCDE
MEVGVASFTAFDIRAGHALKFLSSQSANVHYCLVGNGSMTIKNFAPIELRQHTFVLMPSMFPYSIGAVGVSSSVATTSGLIRPQLFRETVPIIYAGEGEPGILTACGEISVAMSSSPNLFALDKPIVEHFDGPERLDNQFIILLAESARPGIGTRALTESLLKQCLILLLRRKIERGETPLPWMAALAEPGLSKALLAILEHPSDRFTLESLASIAGMSRSAFASHFTRAFGRTPMALLKSERLRRARERLATTNASIEQIAHSVGFPSRSHFSREFRSTYGVDPTKFRSAPFDLESHSEETETPTTVASSKSSVTE